LELVGYGFEGATRAVEGKAPIATEKNRVAYAWDETIEEWFVNDRRGFEHGFTLKRRPSGEGERLELQLAVRGGLEPREAGGKALRFVDGSGVAVIHYAGLKVWDADGVELPARLETTAAGRVRVLVDDREANYPITVDPTAQQAYLKASNTDFFDSFGEAVAVSGNRVLVGAKLEDSNGTGVNPPSQDDNSAPVSGAAYVFLLNQPPTADAGPDQAIECFSASATLVNLSGAGSSDPDFAPLIFTWTGPFPEGGGTVTGSAPAVTLPFGVHVITLTVDDGNGGTDTDTVEITINCIPIASAGPNQRLASPGPSGVEVTLDGSGSSDPNGDSLSYTWSGLFGTRTGVSPTVNIPGGVHTVTLTATAASIRIR